MRQTSLLIGALLFLAGGPTAYAQQQSNEPAKIEVGAHFTSIIGREIQPQFFDRVKSEAGIGARFSYNLNRHIALEAEGNFLPHPESGGFDSDNLIVQGQFGLKAGKRFEKFGVFAKARPGFLSVGEIVIQTGTTTIDINGQPQVFPVLDLRRQNFFSLDLGGVLEFYPTRRILVRFDAGDTMVHLGDARTVSFTLTPPQPPFPRTAHNFQFSSGIAFRFLNPEPAVQDTGSIASVGERRFEAGVQFTSLRLREFSQFQLGNLGFEGVDIQSGFGGRLTYNFTRSIGVEVQTDFFPVELFGFGNGRAGGHMLQVQVGPKIGKRFERFGVFGKVRPGAVSFSKTMEWDLLTPNLSFNRFHVERRNHFSLDVGGVVEFYPSPRIVTRFDAGDTIIRYGTTRIPTGALREPSMLLPAETRHQFQFSAGVGFRF